MKKNSRKKAAIGFDLGGSHFVAGGVADNNLISDLLKIPIDPNWDQQTILSSIAEVIKQLRQSIDSKEYNLVGLGGGAPGPANFETGIIGQTPNMPTMRGCHLADELRKLTGLPTKINNDANLIVFGESIAGAGENYKIVYGCTLGTGFGHGLVINGKIYTGSSFIAMELAKAPIGLPIRGLCEKTIETVVSTGGIKECYCELTDSILNDLDPKKIEDFALAGDQQAIETYLIFGQWLGFAFAWVQGIIAPDIILVGGNISKGWPLFQETMFKMVKKHSFNENPIIKQMVLGQKAGIIGGASLFDLN